MPQLISTDKYIMRTKPAGIINTSAAKYFMKNKQHKAKLFIKQPVAA